MGGCPPNHTLKLPVTDTLRVQPWEHNKSVYYTKLAFYFLSVHQESPLHIATRQGDLNRVKQLIDEEIDVNKIIDDKGVSTNN